MITSTDSLNTIDIGKYYAILPSISTSYESSQYISHHNAEKVPQGFQYVSNTNTDWETIDSLRKMIEQHV